MVSRRAFRASAGAPAATAPFSPLSPLAVTARAAGARPPVRLANDSGHDVVHTFVSATDTFGCASGPLCNSGAHTRGTMTARPAAALNRGSPPVPGGNDQPDGVPPSGCHRDPVTKQNARLVHDHADIGHAFPNADAGPTGTAPVDGHLQDSAPTSWSITPGADGT